MKTEAQPFLTPTQSNQSQKEEKKTNKLSLKLEYPRHDFCYATVIVPSSIVDTLFHEAALSLQNGSPIFGFQHGNVPLEYIKKNFRKNLIDHLQELLFKYCVINFLYERIRHKKLVVVGEPRLKAIDLEPGKNARYVFEMNIFTELSIYNWKFFPFTMPKRKNYKDLDRQVDTIIQEEKAKLQKVDHDILAINDWACFEVTFTDKNHNVLCESFTQCFWLKLGNNDSDTSLQQIFIGKKVGDVFFTNHKALQICFSDLIDTNYTFKITIITALQYDYFCLDHFKRTFRIKTNKEMHRKLIEVFSYRKDMSQRHAIIAETFRSLISKHTFHVPNHLILRQQEKIIESIQDNPDYNVYRVQTDFEESVRNLAEKQTTEAIFIDKLAYHENLSITDDDIKGILNLANRPRMKEFIYFDLPAFKIKGQKILIPAEELKRICLREKTINYAIFHLTKK